MFFGQQAGQIRAVFADQGGHLLEVCATGGGGLCGPGFLRLVGGLQSFLGVFAPAVGGLGHDFSGGGVFHLNHALTGAGNKFAIDELLIGAHRLLLGFPTHSHSSPKR